MGADYKKENKSNLQYHSGATAGAGATWYFTVGYIGNDQNSRVPISVPGVIDHLYCKSGLNVGVGETFTYTVMINGVATALTCNFTGANNTADDLVNAAAVAAGDEISIRIVTSVAAVVTTHAASLRFR